MHIVNLGLLAAVVAAPLSAPFTASAQTTAVTENKKDPNRMVCRSMEATGSRLAKKKECHTAAEWTEIQAQNRRDIERYQANRGRSG